MLFKGSNVVTSVFDHFIKIFKGRIFNQIRDYFGLCEIDEEDNSQTTKLRCLKVKFVEPFNCLGCFR